MIEQKPSIDQLPKEINPVFHELNVLKHLKGSGFKKKEFVTLALISLLCIYDCATVLPLRF